MRTGQMFINQLVNQYNCCSHIEADSQSRNCCLSVDTLQKTGSRILVVKMSSLGDLFHALPTVHNLKKGLGASIDWVVHTEYLALAKCFTDVDRVIDFPRRHILSQGRSFLQQLRASKYDCIIDLQGLLKSALVSRCACSNRIIGPSYCREGAHFFYSVRAGRKNKERHAVEEALDVVKFLGIEVSSPVFPVSFPKRELNGPGKKIAFVPCSRWPTKNWPQHNFIQVGRSLQQQMDCEIFLVGAPADMHTCESIAQGLTGSVVNQCGKTSLVELGSLLQEMDLLVTVDSGPMHMAAALGVPLLAIFGATDPMRTGPYGGKYTVLHSDDLACWPCRSRTCERGDIACLKQLDVDQVVKAAISLAGIT